MTRDDAFIIGWRKHLFFPNITLQSLGDIDVTSCVSKGPLAPCAYHAFTIDFFQCHKNWFLPLLQTCIMTCQNNTIRRQLVCLIEIDVWCALKGTAHTTSISMVCLHLVYAECFSLLYQLHRYIFHIITSKNLIRNFMSNGLCNNGWINFWYQLLIITARQRSGKGYVFICVRPSVILSTGRVTMMHWTSLHRPSALAPSRDQIVMDPLAPAPSRHQTPGTHTWPSPPASDIWWSSLETCSNLLI